jgi:hypothetical protein
MPLKTEQKIQDLMKVDTAKQLPDFYNSPAYRFFSVLKKLLGRHASKVTNTILRQKLCQVVHLDPDRVHKGFNLKHSKIHGAVTTATHNFFVHFLQLTGYKYS